MSAKCTRACERGHRCSEDLQLGPELAIGGFQAVCPVHGDIGRFLLEDGDWRERVEKSKAFQKWLEAPGRLEDAETIMKVQQCSIRDAIRQMHEIWSQQ